MIGYITIGSNDFNASMQFFDELFAVIDVKRLWQTDTMAAWGRSRNEPAFCITVPFDKEVACVGNGTMIAFKVESKEQVQQLHAKAIELGAENEGDAGPRGTGGFYGAYFRDLDGNKFNFYTPAQSVD